MWHMTLGDRVFFAWSVQMCVCQKKKGSMQYETKRKQQEGTDRFCILSTTILSTETFPLRGT